MREQKFKKLERLKEILKGMDKVILAYSGGVDSTFLLKVASEVLGGDLLAVTIKSQIFPKRELSTAKEIALKLGAKHKFIKGNQLQEPNFLKNDKDRCYWCKKELFSKLIEFTQRGGFNCVIEGSNFDDLKDYRPGMEALKELGIRSPLVEARLEKAEIRILSKDWKLPTWNKPSLACLATRIAYGIRIEPEILRQINRIEEFLLDCGFRKVRIRYHGDWTRIEVDRSQIGRFLKRGIREEVLNKLKRLKSKFILLDLEGYRMGSMNLVGGERR
ncbi:MAG TPA: ATP-dependent sacrificial sulfur transferase LarE [Candidatus Omnitrophica bacterium]|nr:ATP-dependent sacrificial sulfur transferase LarE [Candidatus Omnitrophota bacterium]